MFLHLEIITPDQTVFDDQVNSVTVMTAEGEITILPEHMPLVGIVRPGSVTVRTMDGKEQLFAVTRGVVEIDGGHVRLLTDTADRAEDLELAAVEEAKRQAEKARDEVRHDAEGFADANALLERELAKLQVVRRHHSRTRFPPSSS